MRFNCKGLNDVKDNMLKQADEDFLIIECELDSDSWWMKRWQFGFGRSDTTIIMKKTKKTNSQK